MNKSNKTNSEILDSDNPEWTDEMFANAKSGAELAKSNPAIAKLIKAQKEGTLTVRPVGRPVSENPKKSTTVRLDAEVLDFFKAGGKGWQTRMNEVLREYVDNRNT